MARISMTDLCTDLAGEHEALDQLVAPLSPEAWLTPTPADGWNVRDQIGHLCYFDERARLALVDAEAFRAEFEARQAGRAPTTATTTAALAVPPDVAMARAKSGSSLLDQWRHSRAALLEAIAAADPTSRVPWYGPAMSLASFVTARLMETWAHGQDVADGLGAPPIVSDRLRHVCYIGIGARPYAFAINGQTDPSDPIRVEVEAPSGEIWTWGPTTATDRVSGSALDLALVVTQRRHLDDTALRIEGPTATRWISLAQAFAGGPGAGRQPGLGAVTAAS